MSILTGDNPFADYKRELEEKKGPCWTGYKKVKGKKDFSPDSCVKEDDENFEDYWDSLSEDGQIDYVEYLVSEDMLDYDGCPIEEGDEMKGLTQKGGHKRSTESGAGLTQKGVDAVNRKTGGNLKTAVTTPPSKLDPDSKPAKRRKSFCARSRSWTGERGKAARARWNC